VKKGKPSVEVLRVSGDRLEWVKDVDPLQARIKEAGRRQGQKENGQ